MCPVCVTTAFLVVTGGTSLGGVTAMAARRFGTNAGVERDPIVRPKGEVDDDIYADRTEGRVPR